MGLTKMRADLKQRLLNFYQYSIIMKKRDISIVLGILILLFSLWLAFVEKYNHFYEIMLIGLVFILYPLTRNHFDKKTIIKLYLIFLVLAGIFGDFIFGITIGNVWYYHYSSLWEYALLYLLIYPLGGFVMIMSFLLFLGKKKTKSETKIYEKKLNILVLASSILSFLAVLFFIYLKYNFDVPYSGFFVAVFVWVLFSSIFNYVPKKKMNKISYLKLLLSNPKKVLFATFIGTYINALLHEYPNVFAQQWVYQNILFGDIKLFGVSVIVLIGWLALTIFPVSAYYALKK